MLETIDLHPVYDSAEHDLVVDLIIPLLSRSNDYLRGVGYFSSGWLRLAAVGLLELILNGGKARIICCPVLEKSDWEAIQCGTGRSREEVIQHSICNNIRNLAKDLERDTLSTLAWMVADNLLEFKFAVARREWRGGLYHDKAAVFYDNEGRSVAIHGSLNDSLQGSLNGEAYSVFKSWDVGQIPYVKSHVGRLETLWNTGNSQFEVYGIPEAARNDLIKLRQGSSRPYPLSINESSVSLNDPPIKLWPYQLEAIESWIQADCRGVLEMATGTGKTYTALSAAVRIREERGRLVIIILVPYMHLLDQWAENCRTFGLSPILCSSAHGNWHTTLRSRVQEFKLNLVETLCILAVHDTASSDRFTSIVSRSTPSNTMLIADEAHRLGAPKLRNAMLENADLRLGLSATPRRWFDDEGTARIFNYFGQVCFEFPLDKAIGKFLVPYDYHPQLITLTEYEMEEYEELSRKIAQLRSMLERSREDERHLEIQLIRRALIIATAANKIPKLIELLRLEIEQRRHEGAEPHGILIYCAPGGHADVLARVARLGLRCREFIHTVSLSERRLILEQFDQGVIQALVAVKCLDEGVDVPSTRMAYFLASTTNPKEFVQRRGRVLRLCEGKNKAVIYDFLVVPRPEHVMLQRDVDAGLLRREMPRFAEFSSAALNEFAARSIVRPIIDRYGMLNLLEERPWDVYHALKAMFAGETTD